MSPQESILPVPGLLAPLFKRASSGFDCRASGACNPELPACKEAGHPCGVEQSGPSFHQGRSHPIDELCPVLSAPPREMLQRAWAGSVQPQRSHWRPLSRSWAAERRVYWAAVGLAMNASLTHLGTCPSKQVLCPPGSGCLSAHVHDHALAKASAALWGKPSESPGLLGGEPWSLHVMQLLLSRLYSKR